MDVGLLRGSGVNETERIMSENSAVLENRTEMIHDDGDPRTQIQGWTHEQFAPFWMPNKTKALKPTQVCNWFTTTQSFTEKHLRCMLSAKHDSEHL